MELSSLLIQFTTLSGTAALIAVIINILKWLSIVKDGQAPRYSAALNLLALAALISLKLYSPAMDVEALDVQAAVLAEVLLVFFGYITQLGISKLSHIILRNMPIVGTSSNALNGSL